MSADWETSTWSCTGPVDVRTPKSVQHEDQHSVPAFLHHTHRNSKDVAKRLKPGKWKAAFDYEGRPVGFHRLLKSIALGGVDHSIRAEVWEFLLGCYGLDTTAKYRQGLRTARRERYQKLIEQCHHMHASIGTGTLAYTIGSKVMDVRILSKDSTLKEAQENLESEVQLGDVEKLTMRALSDDMSERQELATSDVYENSPPNVAMNFDAVSKCSIQDLASHGVLKSNADCKVGLYIPARSNLLEGDPDQEGMDDPLASCSRDQFEGPISSDGLADSHVRVQENMDYSKTQAETKPKRHFSADVGRLSWSAGSMKGIKSRFGRDRRKKERGMKIGDSAEGLAEDLHTTQDQKHLGGHMGLKGDMVFDNMHEPVTALGKKANGERVAEWLWVLHRIVVDVVRTDRHLDFYGDAKNMARMSDILAVYAWIDPQTGYCQGMSDLLSPFIVIFEDDADAFWCFESLLKRVRQNFQMEGPVGVMKQLEALSKIVEVTDPQMSKHLAVVGADNFLFAFRMLLVLFRREISFGESLFMWEMMWAADFNQAMVWGLEFNCIEALVLKLSPSIFLPESGRSDENSNMGPPFMSFSSQQCLSPTQDFSSDTTFGVNFLGRGPFCGLRPGGLLMKNRQRMPLLSTVVKRNGDEELSVFCVAAILVQNRNKLLKEVQSMDDAIKTFNDMKLIIQVHSNIHTAIKLRKRYQSQLAKHHMSLERR